MSQYLTDDELKDLIDTLSYIYEDYMELGIDPVSVASVMLAVSVKQLQRTLDKDEFNVIMKDLSDQQFKTWDELEEIKFQEEQEENIKKVIH
jgi:hypothetical protein